MDRRSPSGSEKSRGCAFTLPAKGSSRSGFRVSVLTPMAVVQQTPGDVPAGVTESAGHDGLVMVGQHLQFPFHSAKPEEPRTSTSRFTIAVQSAIRSAPLEG